MLTRKLREIKARRDGGEGGFTLIELLVVIIIIGILASIAIPIFMNQQKTARDAGTTSDVKNVATNIQTGLVKSPDAAYFAIADDTVTTAPATGATTAAPLTQADTDANGKLNVWVGDTAANAELYTVTVSKGTNIVLAPGATGGTFVVKGFNANGKSYTTAANGLTYDSAAGGIR